MLDLDKAYVSPYDRFLFEFDATHDKTASQLKEMIKHQRIQYLRDNDRKNDDKGNIWELF